MTSRLEKAQRMSIRRAHGMRSVREPASSGGGAGACYLLAHACFRCRLSFKRPVSALGRKCPNCGGAAHDMGRYFRAPKRTDVEQWEKARLLREAGFMFHGRNRGAPFPDRLSEVAEFIRSNPRHPLRLKQYWI